MRLFDVCNRAAARTRCWVKQRNRTRAVITSDARRSSPQWGRCGPARKFVARTLRPVDGDLPPNGKLSVSDVGVGTADSPLLRPNCFVNTSSPNSDYCSRIAANASRCNSTICFAQAGSAEAHWAISI